MPRLRFTIRRLMIAVAVVSLILGGILWMTRTIGVEVRIAPQPLRANVDHEIFDIVLTDLLSNNEFYASPDKDGKVLVICTKLSRKGYPLDARNFRGKVGTMLHDLKLDDEIVENLNNRNPSKVRFLLDDYKPSNPSIVVRDLDKEPDGYGALGFGGPSWVMPLLPGYSKDGQTALLSFSFGPTMHGSVGYYLLKKEKGRWEIVEKELWHYS
jgi:hypothetical protein